MAEMRVAREIGPDRSVNPDHLVPGTWVWRYTEPAGVGRVWMELPCHDGQQVRLDQTAVKVAVVCRLCATSYEVTMVAEEDGGYEACFTVTVPVVLSRARPVRRR